MFDELRQIATFTNVAESKSFAGAARKLNVSPSIVSHHVSQLEKRFDVALIYRSTRRLRLTKAGEELAEVGRQMLGSVDAASSILRKANLVQDGELRLTAPTIFNERLNTKLLPKFTKSYPSISLNLELCDQPKNLISEGFDLAFRFGKPDDTSLTSLHLFTGSRVVCASAELLKRVHDISSPQDLEGIDAVDIDIGSKLRWKFQSVNNRKITKKVSPNRRVVVNSFNSVFKLAQLGVGVAVLPSCVINNPAPECTLHHILQDWKPPDYEAYLVWPRTAGSNSLTKLFVDFCNAEFANKQAKLFPKYKTCKT